jgi:hypothetical protein
MTDDLTITRRKLLGAAARWSVPTVVTLTLGSKVLQAQASCPPCQRKTGPSCKACQLNQMMNCNCEPCLGPPYCAGSSLMSGSAQSGAMPAQPGGQRLGQTMTDRQRQDLYLELQRQRGLRSSDPFSRDPFARPSTTQPAPGLYDRLRPDTTSGRRP